VDIAILKRWYQSGSAYKVGKSLLVPELLLKNDNLLFPDYDKKKNILNFEKMPEDSYHLLPFNMVAYTNCQIWLTVNVPPGTPPGLYMGEVEVKPDGLSAHKIPLKVKVLPIKLIKPSVNYSVYYHNCIGGGSPIGAFADSYEAEIKDMAERGFNSVMVQEGVRLIKENGQRRVDMTDLKRALDMRVKYGLTAPTLYMGFNWATKEPDATFRKPLEKITTEEKETISYITSEIVKMVKENPQYPELIFVLNVDEPGYDSTGKRLKLAALNCELLHKGGARTAIAINRGGAKKLGQLLDIAILDEPTVDKLYQKEDYRKSDRLEYFYWHPLENPTHDRLRFGLVAWKTNLDGVVPWVYQWAVPSGWLECSEQGSNLYSGIGKNRYQGYTYPAKKSLISTIQWEAVREGIDDVRYLTTLEYWVKKAQASKGKPGFKQTIEEAQRLLALPEIFHSDVNTLNRKLTSDDFENLRSQVAESIIKIKTLLQIQKK